MTLGSDAGAAADGGAGDRRRTPDRADAASATLGGPAALIVGWWMVGLVDVLMLSRHPIGRAPPSRDAEAYLLQLGSALAAGLLSAAVVRGFRPLKRLLISPERRVLERSADFATTLAAVTWLANALLHNDFDSLAARKAHDWHVRAWLIRSACVLALGVGIAGGLALGRWLGESRKRFIGVALALAIAVANYFILEGDYYNLHFAAAWLASTVLAASLTDAPVPAWPRWRQGELACLGAAIAVAAIALVVAPPPGVVARVMATRTDPFTLLLIARGYHGREGRAEVPPEQAAWFKPRGDVAPIPSTTDPAVAQRAIVLMLTIDSLRFDAFEDDKNQRFFPELARLRHDGVHFTNAHSPGSQTVYTLPAWFTGKYFSQLVWKRIKGGLDTQDWPAADPTQHFPALLDAQGIPSTYVQAANWLAAEQGIARGFTSFVDLETGERYNEYARAPQVAQIVIDQLDDARLGPLYVFAHFLDAHVPYHDVKGGTAKSQYLREVGIVAKEIGRIRRRVEELGLTERTTIIVSADHGESLGDHGLTQHGTSVFEELIHVPLVIVGPGYPPRAVDALVSTIDLGPTILDTFGVATPGWMMGESLVAVLEGGEPRFTRPVVAENRLRQTMLFPDGVKVSRDLHFGLGAAFDLKSDPGELDNRIDDPTFDTKNRFALLKAFFDAHTLRTPHYRPPYRR